ncbi:CDP-alcohol phosphatidyltransferase family protein [Cytobacillus firmus]|uniref:CDP-alcohol phosphatidyltransferase family protein n=1 Tax=Cytobacillus firmus TaxID=1399 RepID=UPI0021855945|nr:CDP-alcohol phosphatidyltransferase family protein [Cytobacillus firmus]URM33467.1 CDP-alcohol phosphatidyltransferase family protein [Cytobacillus firmus]
MIRRFTEWYRQFKRRYIVQQRRQHEYAINRYYAHLIDPFFTKIVYDLKMSPNMVTIIATVIGVSAAVSIIEDKLILAAILLQLWHYMDGSDGNLARLTNRCTSFGAKLDVFSDQTVRFTVFMAIVFSVDVSLLIKILFVLTLYVDVLVIHSYVLPFMRKYTVVRATWKQWFLDRGIIPGLDMLTVFFVFSVCAIFNRLDIGVYFFVIFKNIDWMYRVWECLKSKYIYKVSRNTTDLAK